MRTILAALFMTLATQAYTAELQLTGEWFCEGDNKAQINIVNDTLILSRDDKAPIVAEQIYQHQKNDNLNRPIHDFIFKRVGNDMYFFINQMNTKLSVQGVLGTFALAAPSLKFACKPSHMEFKQR